MPRWTCKLLLRLRSLFRGSKVEEELEEEIRFHLENQIEQEVRQGMSPQEARREALRAMGGVEQHKEECRDALGVRLFRDFVRDVRYSLRQLRRSPGFTAAALLTLALGIGANTAIFQLLDRIVLRSLPVHHPHQLIRLQGYLNGRPWRGFTYPLLREMSDRQHTLQGIFASMPFPITEARSRAGVFTTPPHACAVTANYFDIIGTAPQRGRFFNKTDDEPASAPVAVISDRLWRTEFGSQPDAVGSAIHLNGVAVTIIGVALPEFFGERVGTIAELWVPFHLIVPLSSPVYLSALLSPMARLRSDVSLAQAQSELSLLWMQIQKSSLLVKDANGYRVELVPAPQGSGDLHTQFSRSLWLLMAIVGLVAFIACSNLANLLLARATARSQEMSVRLALGAGRVRLIRQLVTEALVLSALGGGLGLALAALASRQLVALASAGESWQISTSIDWRVASFNLFATLASAVLFGVAPALTASRAGVNIALHTGGRALGGGSRRPTAKAFLIAQVALSLVLTAGAALLVRSFWKLTHQDLGFRSKGVLIAQVGANLSDTQQLLDARKNLAIAQRLGEVAAVRVASWVDVGPLETVTHEVAISLAGRTLPQSGVDAVAVGPGYFDAMGIPMIAGMPITGADLKGGARVAVLSESAARLMFGKRNAVGGFFTEGKQFDQRKAVEVIGVVQDLRYSSLRDSFAPLVFYPVSQHPANSSPTFVLRTEGDSLLFADAVRQAVREVAPALRVTRVRTLDSVIETGARRERLLAWLSGAFGGLALILAAVGLYGVVAFAAQRRTPEIGIRLALGARPSQIHMLLLRELIILLTLGLMLGSAATVLFTVRLEPLLFDLTPQDPATFAIAVILLGAIALLAGYIPAHRAARLDPMTALRSE